MRLTWRLALNLITVLTLGIVMVGWIVTQVIGNSGIINKPFKVTADFAASGGVFTNQEVTYRGVLIGKVGPMTLGRDNDGVDIQLLIEPEWENKIPSNVTAEVQSKSAVGEQFVNLTPPKVDSEETLRDGSKILRSNTKLPVDFQALLKSMDRVLGDLPPGQTSRVIENLTSGLRGREGDIKTILASLSTLSDTFVETASEQTRLLDNSTVTGKAFLDSKEEFAGAIRAADKVFADLGDEPGELKRFFEANDAVAREGIALLRRQSGNYLDGIRALVALTEWQLSERELFEQSFDHVPDFLHAVEDSSVPWRDPDGSEYYRIRGGLVLDNVPESWPCGYDNPNGYERLPHVRKARTPDTAMVCEEVSQTQAARELARALQTWASDDPEIAAQRALWEQGELPATIPSDGLIWPVEGAITSPYGLRWGRMHTGIDIDGVTGDPIAASAGGRVTLATSYSGYGNAVIVDHGGGISTLYGHLSRVAVQSGDRVEQGQFLGAMGCTGHCFGDHLHFEVRIDGDAVDPLPYLTGSFSIFGETVADALDPVADAFEDQTKAPPAEDPAPDDNGAGPPPVTDIPDVKGPSPSSTKGGWFDVVEPGGDQDADGQSVPSDPEDLPVSDD